jgi:hypothetical protein
MEFCIGTMSYYIFTTKVTAKLAGPDGDGTATSSRVRARVAVVHRGNRPHPVSVPNKFDSLEDVGYVLQISTVDGNRNRSKVFTLCISRKKFLDLMIR